MKKFDILKNQWYASVLLFIFGAILSLAFAPFGYYPLALFSLAMLLYVWINTQKVNQNSYYGFLYGLGFFSFSVYWLYISIHNYGNANSILAIIITAIFIFYLAIFFALFGFVFTKFFPKNNLLKVLLIFPAGWTLTELLRGWLFTGFPWMFLGYSQIDSPLRGYAPLFGVYGISFLTAYSAAVLIAIFRTKKLLQRIIIIIFSLLIWLGGAILAKIDWTKPDTKEMSVSLVQANIPQEVKWQILERKDILQNYFNLTKNNLTELVVWPEAAIPAFPYQVKNFLNKIDNLTKNNHSTVITGILIDKTKNTKDIYYNAMMSFGAFHNTYLKRHLVPFGEYVPFESIFGNFMKYFAIPMSDLIAGDSKQADFIVNDFVIAPFVCYEIAYPYLVLNYLPKAGLLITISDDSWFGKSIALAQHLEIARMRSLETGRYQLVVANTGLTAIVNSFGEIVAKAPAFSSYVLKGKIQIRAKATFFVCFGKYLWILLIIVCLLMAWHNRSK